MSLTLILGCMFSGKTTELLRLVEREESIGRSVIIINHTHDSSRSGSAIVKTHSGKSRQVDYEMNKLDTDFFKEIHDIEFDTIAINEGQFFKDLEMFVMECITRKKNVIVCGLDSDFRREPFVEMINLVPHANTLVKTTALCSICKDGTEAIYSKRIRGGEDRIQVGAGDSYIPVCRKCYDNVI